MCVKCKLVLKDACQVPCGCRFCQVCIDHLMASGSEFCLGVSNDCGESRLTDFATDYSTNKNVSRLTVKCPQTGCVHECELVQLEEHMRVCGRKSVACPFHELGCKQDKLAVEELNRHFKQENLSHCEILIGVISVINREMKSYKIENEMLNHEVALKDGKIRSIMDQMGHIENEIKLIKEEKADLADLVRILSEKIDRQIDARYQINERDVVSVMQHVDKEITAITSVIGLNKNELDSAITSMKDDIRSINQDSIKSIMCIKSQMQSIQALAGLGQIDASCESMIDEDIGKTEWRGRDRASEYFTGVVHQYKYRLESWNFISEGKLCIWLCIYPGASDAQLHWPFSAAVTITVADKIKREACQSVTLQCEIIRPSNNQYTWSDPFKFSHSSLIRVGLDLTHGARVSCVVIPSFAGS